MNRSSGVYAVIESEVGTLGHAIKDSLGSEDVGRGRIHRGGEVAAPFAVESHPAEIFLFDFYSFGNLCLLVGTRFGELLLNRKLYLDLWINCAAHYKRVI